MRKLLLGLVFAGMAALPAHAALIASFSQDGSGSPVVATSNGTTTTIVVDDASTTVSSFNGGVLGTAFYSMQAVSNDPAATFAGAVIQHYNGTFCFSSAIDCGGTNYLSGIFSDAAFGALGGPGLTVNVNSPPDQLNLFSDVIPAGALIPPAAFSLGFADLSPLLGIDGTTIASFTAGFAGTISSSIAPVPEPMSLALLGMGLLGLGTIRVMKRH